MKTTRAPLCTLLTCTSTCTCTCSCPHADGSHAAATVTSIGLTVEAGLFNPYTMGGYIVVDGVLASGGAASGRCPLKHTNSSLIDFEASAPKSTLPQRTAPPSWTAFSPCLESTCTLDIKWVVEFERPELQLWQESHMTGS